MEKIIKWILEKKVFLLMALFGIAFLAILFQKSCGGGYDSPKYLELKRRFEAHKETAEQKEAQAAAMGKIIKEENKTLGDKVDRLEIEKGRILAESGERYKKIIEKDMELQDLKEKEKSFTGLSWDLVNNLRSQIIALEGKFSLAIEDRDAEKSARLKAEEQIVDLKTIIDNKDILERQLRVALAAEIVARKACEGVIKVGEKSTIVHKLGKLAGDGFKFYGIYSAGRDLLKAAK